MTVRTADMLFYMWIASALALPIFGVLGLGRSRNRIARAIALALLAYVGYPFAVLAWGEEKCRRDDECLTEEPVGHGPNDNTGVDPDRHREWRVG
jgi:hypothetical protein